MSLDPGFRIKSVQCLSPSGLHSMAYKEWGDPGNPRVLVCVHGLTRVSDDFDVLAQELARHYRVVCPDVVGRGRSDWLANPMHYQIPQYVSDMVVLLARLDAQQVDWVGSSMGGLIGMGIASLKGNPLHKLVLVDVGPALDVEALTRITAYMQESPRFADFEQAAHYVQSISAPFGPHDAQQWRKLAADVLRQDSDGSWIRHYDPGLAQPLQAQGMEVLRQSEALLWAAYDAIRCPTLVLRGELSDLLSRETAQAMRERGPRASVVEVAGVGHVPTLVHADQIALVRDFLLNQET